jgi:hypothetical protein
MALIEFVRNYSDRSTDRGYQFEFHCDHCYSGFMSSFQPSLIGAAGGLLEVAGSLFGGILGSAGNSAYSIQRAIGGPAHDRALQQAVTEVKQKFRRCQLCGKWVCADVCWNERASQCVGCTPKYDQEVVSLRTQAQVQATQEQLRNKAANVNYVSGIDMNPDVPVHISGKDQAALSPNAGPSGTFLPSLQETTSGSASSSDKEPQRPGTEAVPASTNSVSPAPAVTNCSACGAVIKGSKFCPECGTKVVTQLTCSSCGHIAAPTARFCGDCGSKL